MSLAESTIGHLRSCDSTDERLRCPQTTLSTLSERLVSGNAGLLFRELLQRTSVGTKRQILSTSTSRPLWVRQNINNAIFERN